MSKLTFKQKLIAGVAGLIVLHLLPSVIIAIALLCR